MDASSAPNAPTGPDLSRRRFVVHGCTAAAMIGLGFNLSACDSGDDGGSTLNLPTGVTVNGKTVTVDLGVYTALASAGGLLVVGNKNTPIHLVAANVGGTIHAFTNVCTHQGNVVSDFTNGFLVCPVHDSVFNATTGAVVEGDADAPLTKYSVVKSGNIVTITTT